MSVGNCSVKQVENSFNSYVQRDEFTLSTLELDILKYVGLCRADLKQLLLNRLHELGGLKFWMCVSVEYRRSEPLEGEDGNKILPGYFPNDTLILVSESEVDNLIDESFMKIASEVEQFQEKGSDWVVDKIVSLDLFTVGYTPLRASSYTKLPIYIQRKRAVVNVHNRDEKCFMWSILAALFPAKKHAERTNKYAQHVNTLDFTGIEFPVKRSDIQKFTDSNEISVNVFSCNKQNRVYPIYRAKDKLEKHVNLFYHDNHYSWIKQFDRLLGDQNAHKAKCFFCEMCLFPQFTVEKLRMHREVCRNTSLAAIEMPSEDDNLLKFKNVHKILKKPLVIYSDFEAMLSPLAEPDVEPSTSYTVKYQQHVPCSYGMVVAKSCCNGATTFQDLKIETSKDPASKFLDEVISVAENYGSTVNKFPLSMSAENEHDFHSAEICYICEKNLGEDRVRDHCHTCGKYRGALHSECNQMLRLDREVVVVMHNLRRYDAHIIMQSIGKTCVEKNLGLSCIPRGMENYLNFSIFPKKQNSWRIRFVDSVQFLSASLETLVDQLDKDKFKAMETFFHPQQVELLSRKNVFCYDFVDSWEKLETPHPIPKECFYNKLNDSHISEADYQHYLDVYSLMGTANLKKYMELYLQTDVLLLADVFEEFRSFALENYQLDPCHYATLPGLAWDACLKMTKVNLELLTDPEMYEFFEAGIRGGISVISKRMATANNKYMDEWIPDAIQSFIMYLDANNLYGWALRQLLPMSHFRFLSRQEIDNLDVNNLDPDEENGYVFEVDLDYPEHLHDKHNDYPLAPEKLLITPDMLSPYCKEIAQKHGLKLKAVEKLAPNLCPKSKYIVHYRNLKFYLENELEITKIHRVLTFKQGAWLAPYIDFHTKKRQQAKSTFQKNLFKLLVNAVFGKTMENVRKFINLELVTDEKRMRKVTKKPRFKRAVIFSENLVGCCVGKSVVCLNKPIYVGFSILDLSKLLMFRFFYDYIKPMYGKDVQVALTDTDSFVLFLQTQRDFYQDMAQNFHHFDTSDYPDGHFLKSDVNKKVVGRMKDELNGKPIEEFVACRSKMYSIKCGNKEIKRAKGVKRKVVEDKISHEDYRNVLTEKRVLLHEVYSKL